MARGAAKKKREQQESPRPATAVAPGRGNGICSTCNQAQDCGHLKRNPGVLIWECENFDGYAEPRRSRSPVFAAQALDKGGHRGLCVNCGNKDTCRFARPETGVWHCEEYKA